MNMTPDDWLDFSNWLKSHEEDIANDINDFGKLKTIFKKLNKFEARKNIEYLACCPRCPPHSHSILESTEEKLDVVFCKVHGEIPVSEVNEALLRKS